MAEQWTTLNTRVHKGTREHLDELVAKTGLSMAQVVDHCLCRALGLPTLLDRIREVRIEVTRNDRPDA